MNLTVQKHFVACALVLLFASCKNSHNNKEANLVQFVNPHTGITANEHQYIGANVPFGLIQVGPVQRTCNQEECSGYHYNDSIILGFGHTHLSEAGKIKPRDIVLIPATDERRSYPYEHMYEILKPGYYSVWMPQADIAVELTTTGQTAFHRYFFPKTTHSQIIIDLKQSIGWKYPAEGSVTEKNDTIVSGYRIATGGNPVQQVYFTALFSQPIQAFDLLSEGARLTFDTTEQESISVKIAFSNKSIEDAEQILSQEQTYGWDFVRIANKASQEWNEQLNKVEFSADSADKNKTFYTNLYRYMTVKRAFPDEVTLKEVK